MPSSHVALKQVLESIEKRIALNEARLLLTNSDEERAKLIEEIADLKVQHKITRDALLTEGE